MPGSTQDSRTGAPTARSRIRSINQPRPHRHVHTKPLRAMGHLRKATKTQSPPLRSPCPVLRLPARQWCQKARAQHTRAQSIHRLKTRGPSTLKASNNCQTRQIRATTRIGLQAGRSTQLYSPKAFPCSADAKSPPHGALPPQKLPGRQPSGESTRPRATNAEQRLLRTAWHSGKKPLWPCSSAAAKALERCAARHAAVRIP